MKHYMRFEPTEIKKLRSAQPKDDWMYGMDFEFETEMGTFQVGGSHQNRIFMYGFAEGGPLDERFFKFTEKDVEGLATYRVLDGGFVYNRQLVATIGKYIKEKLWKGYKPEMGEEVRVLTPEEADAFYAQEGIPQRPEEAQRLKDETDLITENGMPDWL